MFTFILAFRKLGLFCIIELICRGFSTDVEVALTEDSWRVLRIAYCVLRISWYIVHSSWFPPYNGGSATLVN
jgi:hypothetical protein